MANGTRSQAQIDEVMRGVLESMADLQRQNEEMRNGLAGMADIRLQNVALQATVQLWNEERLRREAGSPPPPIPVFQPFTDEIIATMLPANHPPIVLDSYEGMTDPQRHLNGFNAKMLTTTANDHLKCKLFGGTLKSNALDWFATLPNRSITSFEDFSRRFLEQFSARKETIVTSATLWNTHQKEGESLNEFVLRFSDLARQVKVQNPASQAEAFANGLRAGDFNSDLSIKPAASLDEIRRRASVFITMENANKQKNTRDLPAKDKDSTPRAGASQAL